MMALPSEKSMKRAICFLKHSQLCSMSSSVSILRMSVRPVGSPTVPVPPPTRQIGRWPARCMCAIAIRAMKWPAWRLSAVGSKPI